MTVTVSQKREQSASVFSMLVGMGSCVEEELRVQSVQTIKANADATEQQQSAHA